MVAAGIVILLLGVGGTVQAAAPEAPSVFLAPNGDDAAACTRPRPCRTLNRGYRAAARGQVVELAPGLYSTQTIESDPSKSSGSGVVRFVPRGGGVVSVGYTSVQSGARSVAFERIRFHEGWELGPGDGGVPASDITFLNTTGPAFFIMNAANVRVLGGSYGPAIDLHPQIKVYNPTNTYAPTNVVIDGVFFHDFTRSGPDVHTECLQIYAGAGVIVRRNRFRNCDGTGALAFGISSAAPLRNLLVENNMFEAGDGVDEPFYDVQASLCVENLVFRQNTFVKGIALHVCDSGVNGLSAVVGNYGRAQATNVCGRENARYSHNVWVGPPGTKCAATDLRVQKLQVISPQNLHLLPRANAVDKGDPKEYPRRDIDGNKRPSGARPDAGADELPLPPKPKKNSRP